ncbi:hypothetical protein [Alkalihalobacterium sp. APHAB7]|uniref:hypothetical protein n=1 Tax=Alkalihalobacterium sp. APHAB7 TaxID=3402081 RepID=UPI003AAF6314
MTDKMLDKETLNIDSIFAPPLTEDEAFELVQLQDQLLESYDAYEDKDNIQDWLTRNLQKQLPTTSHEEHLETAEEIITTIQTNETNKNSLEEAVSKGKTQESWFASKLKEATSHLTTKEAMTYFQQLDEAIHSANDSMQTILLTKDGIFNRNLNLDGFIAEQHHVNSFNLNAVAKQSPYRAEVLLPKDGQGYGRNSVDIVIRDETGKIVKRYQSKYGADGKSTNQLFDKGDYRGQGKLVPEGQSGDVKGSVENIQSPDGKINSEPLSKSNAKKLQEEAQSGKWNETNWNEYKMKDLATGMGKRVGFAALQGAAIGTGTYLIEKMIKKQKINTKEVATVALQSGRDFGVKAAVASALIIAVKKGKIKPFPQNTPVSVLTDIAYLGVENTKIAIRVGKGDISIIEGLKEMEKVTVSTACGIMLSTSWGLKGAALGSVLGPIGSSIGFFIGGSLGYMAGSEIGKQVVETKQKLRSKGFLMAKKIGQSLVATTKNGFEQLKKARTSAFMSTI